jgi:hypothetical protein
MLKTPDTRSETPQNTAFTPFDGRLALQMFLAQRFQEDVALVHQLAKCTNPGDVFAVYSDFFQRAFADYQREFAEMARLGQICAAEATACGQKTHG